MNKVRGTKTDKEKKGKTERDMITKAGYDNKQTPVDFNKQIAKYGYIILHLGGL